MSNNISNILSNNTKKKPNLSKKINNNTNTNFQFKLFDSNYTKPAVNYTKEKISNVKESYGNLSTTYKILLFFGILLLIFIIGIIIKYYRDQRIKEKFAEQPLFMTDIEQNNPHNTKKIYKYIDKNTGRSTPYIPGYLFNERNGIQYTFSFWMFINGKEWNYRFGEWKHIFHRGSKPESALCDAKIDRLTTQLPGFWISPKENRLDCILTTDSYGDERITLDDIPINKWMNIVVTIDNKNVALYKNGRLEKTINLFGKLHTTKDAVYVNYYCGFSGYMSYLQFFDKILTPIEIQNLYKQYLHSIQKYIHHSFDEEIESTKLHKPIDKNDQCNYLDYIKQEKDKQKYINDIIDVYTILCTNTKGNTETICKNNINNFKKYITDGVPIVQVKNELNNLINNIKYVGDGYQYNDLQNQSKIAYLSKDQYEKIKKLQ